MDRRTGLVIRALRRRARVRQTDVASAASVSQSLISLIERGHLERISIRTLRRVVQHLDADVRVSIIGRGPDLDQLLDHDHARISQHVAERIGRWGWVVRAEVSYSEWGERGSIDLLAFHDRTGGLLVIEVKSRLGSLEATLRKLDEKARLAPTIARTLGWRARSVSKVLVMPPNSADRHLLRTHASVVQGSLPLTSNAVRRWARQPTGAPIAGVWLMGMPSSSARVGPRRGLPLAQ